MSLGGGVCLSWPVSDGSCSAVCFLPFLSFVFPFEGRGRTLLCRAIGRIRGYLNKKKKKKFQLLFYCCPSLALQDGHGWTQQQVLPSTILRRLHTEAGLSLSVRTLQIHALGLLIAPEIRSLTRGPPIWKSDPYSIPSL